MASQRINISQPGVPTLTADKEQFKKKELIKAEIKRIRKDLKSVGEKSVRPPIDIFPTFIQGLLKKHQAVSKLPMDYYLANMLCAASTAIGNDYMVKITDDWKEPSIVWITTVGPPGFGKSPVTKAIMEPVFFLQDEKLNEYERKRFAAAQNGVEPDAIVRPTIYTRGGTMEGIKRTLSNNPHGYMMLLDEIMVLINSMDAYRSGKGADMDNWILLWDNSELMDTLSSGTRRIKRGWTTINGNIQPGRLSKLADSSKKDSGFTARLNFAYPASMTRYPITKQKSWSEQEKTIYRRTLQFLFNLPSRIYTPENINQKPVFDQTYISMTEEAFQIFHKYHIGIVQKYNNFEEDHLKSSISKLDRYAARYALILEMLELACNHQTEDYFMELKPEDIEKQVKVSAKSVHNAIRLMSYFEYTMLKVFDRLDNPLRQITVEWQLVLYAMLEDNFTTQDAKEIAKIGFGKGEETVKKALKLWCDLKVAYRPPGRRGLYEKLC